MVSDSAPVNFTHHFLIAMPGLADETFSRSVVYMCEHSERGALGLVINKPSEMSMRSLFDKVDLPLGRTDLSESPVFQGGPVHTERGFVLHEAMHAENAPPKETVYASTMTIPGGLEMTTSRCPGGLVDRRRSPACAGFPGLCGLGPRATRVGNCREQLADRGRRPERDF